MWGFFTNSEYSHFLTPNHIFLLTLFLNFLNTKPNTLHGILTNEKDKTDRQGHDFSVQDLTVENLNTYNDCFYAYKDMVENCILEKYENFSKVFEGFNGFITDVQGNLIHGKVPGETKVKNLISNQGKKLKKDYHNEFTVSIKKRI